MARPEITKTPLGQRLSEVRKKLGYSERLAFADALGVSQKTLGNYERGDHEPSAELIQVYKNRYGVNLNWLFTGEGEMFVDPSKAPASSKSVNAKLMHRLARLAREVHKEVGSPPHGDTITEDAADLYNELLRLVNHIDDEDEVRANWEKLRFEFKRKLQEQSRNREEGRNIA
ncbi:MULTISPECIES: helix-turn-helix domain-containing protein [Brucella]|uniref:Helix-turn-helix domain-containing protein n=1 Tax=Brucella inopinata TaxID=1218315 RepID=A0AAW7B625_9HYPH|nr:MULTISPECIES: helix-turn-helix domain-containing protein [Brucella]APY14214.1 hypothetical protein BKD02_07960 [Brucella sp. 09RB8910]KEY05900.1 hypothetical protein IL59_0200760 [Brucella suis bv. 4 str. 40]MDL2332877.1 helix-turn-helix domain-containing protein [Brucella inopinata]MRN48019.1 helix-turn-helix domain-containing protein [Brucella sp. 10RB9212]